MAEYKSPSESEVEMRELVMPQHSNPQGTVFGGQNMAWIDLAAAMAAARHAGGPTVTVHVDDLSFDAPVKIGQHVLIKASVNYVGNSSMEVGVKVMSENPMTGETRQTTKAYLTFVALDENGRPKNAPKLRPKTADQKRRYKNAKKRFQNRQELARTLQKHR